jgi:DNA-3-methyladenine glycosylase
MKSDLGFLNQSSDVVAQLLLGCILERNLDGQLIKLKIVETEAYSEGDAASHSYKPKTKRTEVMFGEAGHLYVYFTYGMHYCANVVTGKQNEGEAVLIRAVEPLNNEDVLKQYRRGHTGFNLTNGPAKLCQAIDIDKRLNGHNLNQEPLKLLPSEPISRDDIIQTTRIGISQNQDLPLRFYIKNNPYVSRVI